MSPKFSSSGGYNSICITPYVAHAMSGKIHCVRLRAGQAVTEMRRFLLFSLSCALAAGISGRLVVGIEGTSFDHYADSIPSAHASEVPLQLREGWLRFHEAELCQGVDAVFVFHKKGMEVWCRVEDEKNYHKFTEMLEPLRASYQIDLYATRPTPEEKSISLRRHALR